MRVTDKMMSNNMMWNMSSSMGRIDKLYNQIATGRRINRPSDDPVGMVSALRLTSSITQGTQYISKSETSKAWLNATDSALGDVTSILHKLEELAVGANSGAKDEVALDAISLEIKELKEHLRQLANTQHEGRYLFGGQTTKTQPYDDTFTYMGDEYYITPEVGPGSTVPINTVGSDIFDGLFSMIDDLTTHIDNGDLDAVSNNDIAAIQDQLDNVLTERATIGAKVNRMERNIDRLKQMDVQYNQLLVDTVGTDIAEAATILKSEELVYQTTLILNSRLLQTTLANYI